MPEIFLSYARADGEPLAEHLRRRLKTKAPDIVVKYDRLFLEGGHDWWKQVAAAIEDVRFLLLLLTPAALRSGNVEKEWRHARRLGVCVYPVKDPKFPIDFQKLPRWMQKSHCIDLEKEWPTLLQHLRSPCHAPRIPFMAPDLPPHFVPRPAQFEALKNLLLSPDRTQPVAIATSLTGAGGFGKTTLAAALCHDDDIVTNFDAGILWVTLGQTPNLIAALGTLYAALTGDRPAFLTIEDAAGQLGQKLEDRACLVVIDDVWDTGDLRPFLRGGNQAARLFTTRNAGIASSQAKSVDVDEMTQPEGVAMLRDVDPARAAKLAQDLGEWPLALELAAATIRERVRLGEPSPRAVERVSEIIRRKGAKALEDPNADPRHRSITAVLNVSLELLSREDRQRLAELSIFPEDIAFPLAAVAALWHFDDIDSDDLAQKFARLSLLKLDLNQRTLRLHDVMRQWLATQDGDPPSLHSRLVDAWPDWRNLPHDYAWRWLPWHLAQAGRNADIARLLGDPVWMLTKLKAADVNALLGDYEFLKDEDAELVQGALRLSANVLAREPDQFASQLVGRLLLHCETFSIRRFIEETSVAALRPWLRPLHPALHPPGTALMRTLEGHASSVYGVAVTGDGKRAVSASWDYTLKVWDLETGRELRTLEGHSDSVYGVALTEDGKRAVSASGDNTLKVWDLETGRELRTLEGHTASVKGVAVTADGKRAVSASLDNTLKVWDLETGRELHTLEGHSDSVYGVAVTGDGKRAVSVSWDKTLKVWDLETGRELRTLQGHSADVNGVAVTGDGKRAVSASDDKTLKVWDLETGRELRTLEGHSDWVRAVAVTGDGKRAVSASDDKTLKVWDLETGRELRMLEGHSAGVNGVAVTEDGKRAVSASNDNTLKVWDLETGRELRTPEGHSASVTGVAATGDRRRAVSASSDNTLMVWDLETGRELRTLEGHSHSVYGVAVTGDGKRAVSASGDNTLKVWDLELGRELRTLEGHSHSVYGVAVTGDGKRAISASWDNTLKVWDLETGRELRTLAGHSNWVNGVAVTGNGKRAVSASGDRTLKVWDLETGRELRTLEGHSDSVDGVAVTGDGKRAVSASWDKTLKVWDLETGRELRTLQGHSASVNGVAVTGDGKRAVSASDDKTLKVWDLETGLPILTFHCDSTVRCCAFADDQTIIAGDEGGHLHFLRLEE